MSVGQAILFTLVGGGVALLAAAVVAFVVSSAVRKSAQRQMESQLKAQKDLNDEQIRNLKWALQEGQQQQQESLEKIFQERAVEPAPVIVQQAPPPPPAPVSENGPGPDSVALRERLLVAFTGPPFVVIAIVSKI